MIETIDFIFHFRRETYSMQLVTMSETAHDFTDLADFADDRTRVAIFDINAGARFDAVACQRKPFDAR